MSPFDYIRDPFEAARNRAVRPWRRRVPADRKAPPSKPFVEHILLAALAWAHRLRIDRRAERRLAHPAWVIRRCATRWGPAVDRVVAAGGRSQARQRRLSAHRTRHGGAAEEGGRLRVAAVLSWVAIVAFVAVEYEFARAGLDLLLEEPGATFFGMRVEDIGALAIAVIMAGAAEVLANEMRGILGSLPTTARRIVVAIAAVALPLVFLLPFLSLREEGAGGGGAVFGGPVGLTEQAHAAAAAPGASAHPLAFLALGLGPVLVGAVLQAASSSPSAHREAQLGRSLRLSSVGERVSVWRFERLGRRLDRAERRLARRLRGVARRHAGDEAGRVVDRVGYRLLGAHWNGWLEEVPSILAVTEATEPGVLPGGWQDVLAGQFGSTVDDLVFGGPVRRRLEDRKPLAGAPRDPRQMEIFVDAQSANNHHSREST